MTSLAALGRGHEAPLLVGLLGGGHGGVHVAGVAVLEVADDVVRVGGVDVGEGLARLARDPLAVDIVLVDRSFLSHALPPNELKELGNPPENQALSVTAELVVVKGISALETGQWRLRRMVA